MAQRKFTSLVGQALPTPSERGAPLSFMIQIALKAILEVAFGPSNLMEEATKKNKPAPHTSEATSRSHRAY